MCRNGYSIKPNTNTSLEIKQLSFAINFESGKIKLPTNEHWNLHTFIFSLCLFFCREQHLRNANIHVVPVSLADLTANYERTALKCALHSFRSYEQLITYHQRREDPRYCFKLKIIALVQILNIINLIRSFSES